MAPAAAADIPVNQVSMRDDRNLPLVQLSGIFPMEALEQTAIAYVKFRIRFRRAQWCPELRSIGIAAFQE